MARKPNILSQSDLSRLKQEVVRRAGFTLLNPVDCERLSDAIIRRTKNYLSPSTLKRFWGFHTSGFNPSYQTLDILAVYCGYDGWTSFVSPKVQKLHVTDEELYFFKSIFNIKDYYNIQDHDETMQLVSRRIAERLRADPKAFEEILPELAKNTLAQIFYFEHFPDYDNLVSFQYKGYIEYLKNKVSPDAQIFGNCLLFFRAFLLNDSDLMRKYFNILLKIEMPVDLHPMPMGRYYQCIILYTHFVEKSSLDKLLKQIFQLESKIPAIGLHFKNFPGFHYFVADSLVLTGHYKEAMLLIDKASERYKIYKEFVWKGYYRQFQLMYAECYYALKKPKKAQSLLLKINPDNFYFISRNYFKVRFNLLKIKISKRIDSNLLFETESIIESCHFKVFSVAK